MQERPCGAMDETAVQTALAAGFPKTKAWRAKPATPLQASGPDVRLARTHGPPSASPTFVTLCGSSCSL